MLPIWLSALLYLSTAHAQEITLSVPLPDLTAEDAPEEGLPGQEEESDVPMAWSAVGPYEIGDAYEIRSAEGKMLLYCEIRSFERHEDTDEIWATLHCPLAVLASR